MPAVWDVGSVECTSNLNVQIEGLISDCFFNDLWTLNSQVADTWIWNTLEEFEIKLHFNFSCWNSKFTDGSTGVNGLISIVHFIIKKANLAPSLIFDYCFDSAYNIQDCNCVRPAPCILWLMEQVYINSVQENLYFISCVAAWPFYPPPCYTFTLLCMCW